MSCFLLVGVPGNPFFLKGTTFPFRILLSALEVEVDSVIGSGTFEGRIGLLHLQLAQFYDWWIENCCTNHSYNKHNKKSL